MATSITSAQREVQRTFEAALIIANGTGKLHETEAALWTALLALGRALITLFMLRAAARPRPTTYEHDGAKYAFDGKTRRRQQIGTRFGKVLFVRGVGHRIGGSKRERADLPVDRELGLCSGFSLGVVAAVGRLCAQMAFATARDTFASFHEWAPSSRATLRMVDAVGAEARPFLERAAVPDDDGEVLVIQADGGGAPMISAEEYLRRCQQRGPRSGTKRRQRRTRRREHPRPRRKKGDKSKNAKVAFVGVIYTLQQTPDGVEGPINKRVYATFESHEALFAWLRAEAERRGYGRKRTLFLADGCEHIWRGQQKYFPDAEPCIDWFHVAEKLWLAGACLHAEGSRELADWVAEQQRQLRRGRTAAVYNALLNVQAAIPRTGPGSQGRRKRIKDVLSYFAEHRPRMRYAELRRDDLDIGSGAIEGAVRNLVRVRLDGPGMRWGRDRAEAVLHLRCIHLNGQWDEFTTHLTTRHLALAPQPLPARTHDAKPNLPKAA